MKSFHRIPIAVIALITSGMVGCATMGTDPQPKLTSNPPIAPEQVASGPTHVAALGGPTPTMRPTVQFTPQAASLADMATPGVSQVGFFHAAGGGNSACGCQACGPQACAPQACQVTPHGYAMMPQPCPPGFDPQEYLCDGGDQDPRAIVRRDDSIGGLQPEDTVVHYTTDAGDIEINASNRVCVYAPRFASVRKITGAVSGGRAIGLKGFDLPVGANNLELNEGGVVIGETVELGHAEVARRIDAMRDRNRGVPVESVQQPIQAVDVMAVLAGLRFDQLSEMRDDEVALVERLALAAIAWTIDESVQVAIEDIKPPTLTRDQTVEGLTVYDFPDAGRLQIVKLADRADARPGDIVTFAIRVENVGDSAVSRVTLTDNLTTRLEYVPESQTASGGAEFSTVANAGESLQLIWKLTDKLRVGESVTIRFQCKVR